MPSQSSRFVVDGCWRAQSAMEGQIREEVLAEYRQRLDEAGFWQWVLLHWQIGREVRLRLDRLAPPDALY